MNPERNRWRVAMHMNNAAINIAETGNIDYSIFSSQLIKRKLFRIANEKDSKYMYLFFLTASYLRL